MRDIEFDGLILGAIDYYFEGRWIKYAIAVLVGILICWLSR